MSIKKLKSFFVFLFIFSTLFAQESLKSTEEEYYDFLSLQGIVERPTLGYRTLSDSKWEFLDKEELIQNQDGTFSKVTINGKESAQNIWKNNNLGSTWTLWQKTNAPQNWFTRGINQDLKLKIYGPEWFNSFNTAAPYGQNDGALWQGRGYNTSLTAGVRLEAFGFEVTVKPQVSFIQNLPFDYITPNYSGTTYEGKADTYGYYGVASLDAPQRFGESPFFTFDWGDSEIRWSWHNFTMGFGTQSPWLGPAKLNPIIHSNNAASYPKIDIGLRKTALYMPYLGWHLGDIEVRGWWGKLSESEYFDNDDSNDNNLITGLSFNYACPGILKGLTLGLNRTMLSKWNDFSAYTLLNIFIPGIGNLTSGGDDSSDQRISLTADYLLPKVGLEIYFEWARNDFSPNLDFIIRYPFHTQGWTAGIEKTFILSNQNSIKLLLECTDLQTSADYDRLIGWYTTFYAHHKVTQGYTNKGQWLGAGIGTGGNSQYLGIKWLSTWGALNLFVQRRNPDLDYTMYIDSKKYPDEYADKNWIAEGNIRCIVDIGIESDIFITKNCLLNLKYIFEDERNPLNISNENRSSIHRYNHYISLTGKYNF